MNTQISEFEYLQCSKKFHECVLITAIFILYTTCPFYVKILGNNRNDNNNNNSVKFLPYLRAELNSQ
jgi:hypothetical protein